MSRDIFNRDKGFYGKLVVLGKQKECGCKGTYTPQPVTVLNTKEEAPDVFTIRIAAKLDHAPGQFLQCSILGAGESPISFSSWNPAYVDLTIKNVGRVTKELCKLKAGETMHIRGPYGHGYPMDLMTGNDIILVAAGTGVAPLRGVLQYLLAHRNDFGKITCYYGFRAPEDILFKDEIASWQKQVDLCLSMSKAPESWHGPVGRCTDALQAAQLDNHNKIAIVCGPPAMIDSAATILKTKGFHEDQIYVSHERHMKCATGVCGHCMIKGQYCCRDGPVFRYDKIGSPQE